MRTFKHIILAAGLVASAQAAPVLAQDSTGEYEPPRTSWGVPDLQGTWNIATVTMLERGPEFNGKPVS
jgi:hypothetical protein